MTDFAKRVVQGFIIVSCMALLCGCLCARCRSVNQDCGRYQITAIENSYRHNHVLLFKCDRTTGDVYVIDLAGTSPQVSWRKIE